MTQGQPGSSLAKVDEQPLAMAERGTAALAAGARAAVEARYVMALKRPREWLDVRAKLLKECRRPAFAQAARYRKPMAGGAIEGWSVRFAEACLRLAGNAGVEAPTLFEDESTRIIRVTAIDYETNASFSTDVTIEKTVERHNADGRVVVRQRKNSTGKTVYIVEAEEEELLGKQGSFVSKHARNNILRLVPADILEECKALVISTSKQSAVADPEGEKKKLIDAFQQLGIYPSKLAEYLGHSLDAVQPAELVELREIFTAIRDGEATWDEETAKREAAEASSPKKPQAEALADSIKNKGKKAPAKADHDPATGEIPSDASDAYEPPETK